VSGTVTSHHSIKALKASQYSSAINLMPTSITW